MMKKLKTTWCTLITGLRDYLDKKLCPSDEDLVRSLVLHTSRMCLERNHYVELAPVRGMLNGSVRLRGNSLPVFSYLVFHKPIMEFVRVTVEISSPARIQFVSVIESNDPKANGKIIETLPKFSDPFFKLAGDLYRYFPYYTDPPSKSLNGATKTWNDLLKNGSFSHREERKGEANGVI